MIDLLHALKWLNKIHASALNPQETERVNHIRNLPLKDPGLDEAINALFAQPFGDNLALGEALMTCAGARYYWDDPASALSFVDQAIPIYKFDLHRLATALWVKGIIETALSRHAAANAGWNRSKDLFKALFLQANQAKDVPASDWYWDLVKRLETDLALTLNEAENWYNQFRPQSFNQDTAAFDRMAEMYFENKSAFEMKALLGKMGSIAKNSAQRENESLIKLHGAVLLSQLNEADEANSWMGDAVRLAPMDSHEQHAARWIQGLTLLSQPERKEQALVLMKRAIEGFGQLAAKADFRNEQEKRRWYQEKRDFMQLALAEAVSSNLKQ